MKSYDAIVVGAGHNGLTGHQPMKSYDAIVVGAGHNGLTAAAFLAKAGLDVVCVENNDYIGGATVSRNLYKDWWYSNCSYVCSLLRPEIYRSTTVLTTTPRLPIGKRRVSPARTQMRTRTTRPIRCGSAD
jgi:phytoene dehydrogenase-like protein